MTTFKVAVQFLVNPETDREGRSLPFTLSVAANAESYDTVAVIEVEACDVDDIDGALNAAWAGTQNFNEAWVLDPAVNVAPGGERIRLDNWKTMRRHTPNAATINEVGIRSTMIGDIFAIHSRRYAVTALGFEQV